ncbi:MAG: TIGR03987 family protein [Anaerolineaceae bacterium]|nr:TIGR03987 family protein [Anaerolineaceae bacterium]
MTTTLIIAIILMVSALTLYTIGVWSEKISGQLKKWHLALFWFGFIADTGGTTLMGKIAGGFSFNMHSIIGLAALSLMLIHAVWATIVLLKNDKETASKFHRFSIPVWGIWIIPFFSGLYLAMFGNTFTLESLIVSPEIHVSVGGFVLITSLVSFLTAGWLTWKKKPLRSLVSKIFIGTQILVMLQILVGIKLLDQGFGPLQSFGHYLSGIAPIASFMLFYWIRRTDKLSQTRLAATITGSATLFILITFIFANI